MPARQLRSCHSDRKGPALGSCPWRLWGAGGNQSLGDGVEWRWAEPWDLESPLIHSPHVPEVGQGALTPLLLSTHSGHQAQAGEKPRLLP